LSERKNHRLGEKGGFPAFKRPSFLICSKLDPGEGDFKPAMQILKAGIFYFTIVFGAGFLLGPIRILWIAPRFGTRMAELMETPIMFVVILIAARWVVRRLAVPSTASRRLGMGCVALGFLVAAEFTLVLWLRGLPIREYLATRDAVSGTVYYLMLGVFATMPLLVARR
jgi:hypothetical protein